MGFDFNPVADRIRVGTDSGLNLRLHPETGAVAAADPEAGSLVTQGSVEGVQPAISPNTGLLRTVGPLGTGAVDDAAFDIADTSNAALAALRQNGRTRLYLLDLATGRATALGTVGDGRALWGMAIEPWSGADHGALTSTRPAIAGRVRVRCPARASAGASPQAAA